MRHIFSLSSALAFAAATVLPPSAMASSPDAWAAHEHHVVSRCVAASGFEDAAPAGEPVIFDDDAGITALLIQGHRAGAKRSSDDARTQDPMGDDAGQELCLYRRASETVYIAEADKLAQGSDALPATPTDALNGLGSTSENGLGDPDTPDDNALNGLDTARGDAARE
ncbi:hypothetical protein [Salinicola halophilus]|uniref:hypothetical protein n=1 Tax=Salinicola halophilus TaxID=184065 RepID=UPI000DA25B20|nr:hypothetical protein [Salinicola halophilus]